MMSLLTMTSLSLTLVMMTMTLERRTKEQRSHAVAASLTGVKTGSKVYYHKTLYRNPNSRYKRRAPNDDLRFGVMLDAGSSGSKLKIYSSTSVSPPVYVPQVELEVSEKFKPGLGQMVGSLEEEVRAYLTEVLLEAKNEVPPSKYSSTPIFLMATAGLRVLTAEEARGLLGKVRKVLGDSSVSPFKFHPEQATILSGEEEAVYAWVAVNYLRRFFRGGVTQTVGVMEIGGGSMQVTFLPDTPLYQEEFQVYIGPRRFDLYAESYLDYGVNYLSNQVKQRLIPMSQEERLFNPCMLHGDSDSFTFEGVEYMVNGTGNITYCEDLLSDILQAPPGTLCSPAPCAIGNTYQPKVGNHPFYAISAFNYAPKALNALDDGVLNIPRLRTNARSYCELSVEGAVAEGNTIAKFASNNCLMGLYIPILLTNAIGFEDNTRSITIIDKINNTDIDWALGAMVQSLSMDFLDDMGSQDCPHSVGKSMPLVSRPVTFLPASTPLMLLVTLVWAFTPSIN